MSIKPISQINATRKLYYEDSLLRSAEAYVVKAENGVIELDQTVAFPEGGGQEGDRGVIWTSSGLEISFYDTRKRWGRPLYLPDFPVINVDCVVEHVIDGENASLLDQVEVGEAVRVEIDVDRRARLTLSHTASHLVYVAANQVRPDAVKYTKGCHIKADSARFDFATSDRFTPEQLGKIVEHATALVIADYPVRVFHHDGEPEAIYWECAGETIPCGGTHLASTGVIGPIALRRKCLGRGMERLILTFPEGRFETSHYHD